MTLWLALLVKTSILLAGASAAALCARRASASVRHAILAAGLVGALVLPAPLAIVPTWEVPQAIVVPLPPVRTAVNVDSPVATPAVLATGIASSSYPWARIAASLWMLGSALSVAILIAGLWRLRQWGAAAAVAAAESQDAARSLAAAMG